MMSIQYPLDVLLLSGGTGGPTSLPAAPPNPWNLSKPARIIAAESTLWRDSCEANPVEGPSCGRPIGPDARRAGSGSDGADALQAGPCDALKRQSWPHPLELPIGAPRWGCAPEVHEVDRRAVGRARSLCSGPLLPRAWVAWLDRRWGDAPPPSAGAGGTRGGGACRRRRARRLCVSAGHLRPGRPERLSCPVVPWRDLGAGLCDLPVVLHL